MSRHASHSTKTDASTRERGADRVRAMLDDGATLVAAVNEVARRIGSSPHTVRGWYREKYGRARVSRTPLDVYNVAMREYDNAIADGCTRAVAARIGARVAGLHERTVEAWARQPRRRI